MKDSEPIRIAQIMGKLWAGGVETVVFNYYRKIDKTKIQFDFYYDSDSTVEPSQEIIDMGARFYKIPPYQMLPAYLKVLRKYFRNNDYKIVHSHINTLSIFPLYAAWREGVPVRIAHNHSVPGGHEFKRNSLKYVLRFFAKVFPTDFFACSEKAGRWLFGNRTFDKEKVYILKNAIDFKQFIQNKKKVCPNLEGKLVIGHIGRFTYAKNHKFLIDIFEKIHEKKKNAVLLLVGDGEKHDEIVGILRSKKLLKYAVLIGKVTNASQYYQLINVMILPSLFEGLSLTTIESQIAGVPVVISESIPDEAIISNGCCRMKLNDSADKWAEAAIRMTNENVVLNESSQYYDMEHAISKLQKWYLTRLDGII